MQAGEFAPTPHSKLMYNEAFRANQYVAAGIKPIYIFNDMFHLRGEFYGFIPIFPIEKNRIEQSILWKSFLKGLNIWEKFLLFAQLPFRSHLCLCKSL